MKTSMKTRTKIICKIKHVYSPIMETDHGLQFLAAVPNTAGFFFGKPCASYRHPYLLYSGLVVDETYDFDIARHLEILDSSGYEMISLKE